MSGSHDLLSFGEFLDLHRQHPVVENALEKSLFDSHFLNCSPLARRARRLFLEAGFKFKIPETSSEINRFAFSTAYTLPMMYEAQTIYYRSNAEVFEIISQEFPHLRKYPVRYVVPNFEEAGNKIFHESVHFLNFRKFFNGAGLNYQQNSTDTQTADWFLKHLAIESAVLAVELLSTIVSPGVANDYARHLSCHQLAEFPKDYDLILTEGLAKMGALQTYRMLCYGFLVANLFPLETALSESRRAVLNNIFKNPQWVTAITDRCLKLSTGFRTVANSRYFLSLGCEKDYNKLLQLIVWEQAIAHPQINEIFDFNFEMLMKPEFGK